MPIRFRCPNCDKALSVRDELAGKKGTCPGCKKLMVIPVPKAEPAAPPPAAPLAAGVKAPPTAAEIEALAAETFGEKPPEPKSDEPQAKPIKVDCQWCGETVEFAADLAGKQAPCPNADCRRIVKVPLPKAEKPKDWRELERKGPAAALINQPEKIDEEAWGTATDKTRVSGKSLVEAGVVKVPAKPGIGVKGWITRITVGVAALAGLAFVGNIVLNLRHDAIVKQRVDELIKEAKAAKLPPPLMAEVHRAAAEIFLAHRKPKALADAKTQFTAARAMIAMPGGTTDQTASNLDHDLFLGQLALSQLGLGGTQDEQYAKIRFDWKETVRKELAATLHHMRTIEGKSLALRQLFTRLSELGEPDLAVGLATSEYAQESDASKKLYLQAQQIAMMVARDQLETADKVVKMPNATLAQKKLPLEFVARVGYAEGFARKGELEKAKALVTYAGQPFERMEAALGAATVLEGMKKRDEAKAFLEEALNIAKERARTGWPEWTTIQLVRLCALMGQSEAAKDLLAKLPAASQARCKFELYAAEMAGAGGKTTVEKAETLEKELGDKATIATALAWRALAENNARHGSTDTVIAALQQKNDARLTVMGKLGQVFADGGR